MYPEDFLYTKDHEWIKVEDGVGTIGITDFAQQELGDVVYLDLPEVGRAVAIQEVFGNVESVKAVSDLFSPVSGEVTEVNAPLQEDPEKLNEDPHGNAWLMKVRLSKPEETKDLMSAAAYADFIKG